MFEFFCDRGGVSVSGLGERGKMLLKNSLKALKKRENIYLVTYFYVDCNTGRAHGMFHVLTVFPFLADNGRKLVVTMKIINVTEDYDSGLDFYICRAYPVNGSSKIGKRQFNINVIQGMFFYEKLDELIFRFREGGIY